MEPKKNLLTYEGLKRLENELDELKGTKRKEIAEKIKEAREQGDLSENAEYEAAREEQRNIEARIEELEKILKNAEVADEDNVDPTVVNVGCNVTVLDLTLPEDDPDREQTFQIVGPTEANSLVNMLSNESPLGSALIGAREGDVVEVEAPVGTLPYQVLKIVRNN